MSIITKKEKEMFLLLYNRGGYVLDFTNNTFDVFTTVSVGEALQKKYGLSKGKSLVAYLNEASDTDRTKLLVDLFHHYEEEMEYEYNPDYEDILWSGVSRYEEKYAKMYLKCNEIVNRLDGGTVAITKNGRIIKNKIFQ